VNYFINLTLAVVAAFLAVPPDAPGVRSKMKLNKTARSIAFLVAFGISGQALPAEFNEPVIINGSLTVTGDVVINAPWGKVSIKADKEGLIIQNLTGTDGGAAALVAQTQWGEVKFAGNELRVTSTILDPAKVRIGSPQNLSSGLSFDHVRPDGVREEVVLLQAAPAEDDWQSLGGQIKMWVRRKNASGDAAMRLMGLISSAHTDDGLPRVYWLDSRNNLGLFAPSGAAPGGAADQVSAKAAHGIVGANRAKKQVIE
jgi:hypothetical protein